MIGSLILKIAGPIESLPKVRNSTDFALSNRIHNPKVAPPPPNAIIYDQNGYVKKCTNGLPALYAAILVIKYICMNGNLIGCVILAPCKPKNQNV